MVLFYVYSVIHLHVAEVQISPAMRHSHGDGTMSDDVHTYELSALLPLLVEPQRRSAADAVSAFPPDV